jgi:predicted amidophosphoribosyltransferase
VPCDACRATLPRAPVLVPPTGCDLCRAVLAYEGTARKLVTGLKYVNDRAVLGWLAAGLAGLLVPPPGAVVTWAPTSARRRRQRGYDQAELLARAVARRWRRPCRALLRRAPGPPQTGRSLADRLGGVPFVPAGGGGGGRGGRRSRPTHVVVVDDVVTTGATLRTAALALRSTGVVWIAGLAAAATPRHAQKLT